MHKYYYLTVFIFFLIINGCSGLKNSAGSISEELVKPIKENADTVGYRLVQGMRESLTGPEAKEQLNKLLDSLITNIGNNTNIQLTGIRDSVFNNYLVNWLQNGLLGPKTSEQLVRLRNSFFDSYLQEYITKITTRIGPDILNDSTLSKLGAARDTLIGEKTNRMIKAIVDSAMYSIINRINKDINPAIKENLDFLQKNAVWLIILIGIIAIIIILLVWNKKESYLKLTKMLAFQISEVTDKNLKETLKTSISRNAKTIGIEDELRKLLEKSGLLHEN